MIILNIQLPCPSCATQPGQDSQPNYCRKCGGLGYLRSTISAHKLARMGEIPQILGASVTVVPRRRHHKADQKVRTAR